jgi:hypothetical protein
MSAKIRALLNELHDKVEMLGKAIPVVERKSLCFYDGSGDFFAEFIPMTASVRILVPGPFEELEASVEIAADAKRWMWMPYAVHTDCGAVIDVWNSNRVEIPLASRDLRTFSALTACIGRPTRKG